VKPHALAATSLLAVVFAACSAGIDRSVYTSNVCVTGGWDELHGVVAADPARALQSVTITTGLGSPNPSRGILSTLGAPCANAPDKVACDSAMGSAAPKGDAWKTSLCGGAGCREFQHFFLSEKAGAVDVIETLDALRAAIAPVDNASDAVLLAAYTADGLGVDCTKGQARPLADGAWEVYLATGDGQCTDRVERRVRVERDGRTASLATLTTRAAKTCLYP